MRVVLEDVVVGYGFGDVLRGLDLVAEEGEITCLIGPNGAGKSTVLRAVSGLLQPRRGSIRVGEHEISGVSPRGMLELGVVHVPQERSLFPLMTVWENLLMGGYILRDGTEVRRRAEALVEQNARSGLAIADRGAVLDGGVVKLTGPGSELLNDPEVGRLYLGAGAARARLAEDPS